MTTKQYHTKASIAKHMRSVKRNKMRKEIAKIAIDIRAERGPNKNIKSIANISYELSEYFGANAVKAMNRLSGYNLIYK